MGRNDLAEKKSDYSRNIELDRFQEQFEKRYRLKKKVNVVLCLGIVFCGVTAVLYSVFVNHMNLFNRLRYLTFNGTIFTTIVSLIFAVVSIAEARFTTEVTLAPVYFLRLSSAATELVIMVIVMIGLLPVVPDQPDITSYTGIMMHLVIPPATVLSFSFNDAPIGKLKPLEPLYGTWFITIYAVVMLILFGMEILPAEMAPYSFLDVRHHSLLFTVAFLGGIYMIGYVLALFLSFVNRKLSWLWFYDPKRRRRSGTGRKRR